MSLFNPVRADVNTLRIDMFLLSRRPQLNMHLHLALGCGVGLVDLFVCRAVVQVNDPLIGDVGFSQAFRIRNYSHQINLFQRGLGPIATNL